MLALTLLGQTMDFIKVNPLSYLVGFETREQYPVTAAHTRILGRSEIHRRLVGAKGAVFVGASRVLSPSSAQVQEDEILDNFRRLRFQVPRRGRDFAGVARTGLYAPACRCWGLDFELADNVRWLVA